MLVERQASKAKQTMMIILVLITNLVVGVLIYQNFFPKKRLRPSAAVVEFTPSPLAGSLADIGALTEKFDVSVITRPDFASLRKIGNWPVTVGPLGKPDPFLPVFGE